MLNMFYCWKDENKEKEAKHGPFYIKMHQEIRKSTSYYNFTIFRVINDFEIYRGIMSTHGYPLVK